MSRFRGFAAVGIAVAAVMSIVACGGGGGGTMNPPPTMTPTVRPTTTPTVPPFVCPSGGCTMFTLGGTSSQTVTRAYPTPTPKPQVVMSTVAQTLNVVSGAVFHGEPATDYKTMETDTAPTQTLTTNTDNYIQFPATTGNVVNIGYHSTDSNGVVLDVQYLSGNGVIGQIPLGAGWANNASSIVSETDPDGTTIAETINADGSYTLTKTEVAGTTTATMNSDSTGTAIIPTMGFFGVGTATQLTVPAQSGGIINYEFSAYGAPSPAPSVVLPVGAWYAPSPTLASDTSTNLGVHSIPAGCVAASFGSSGVDVRQQETQLDTIFGLLDAETTDTWVTSVGPVCERISDTLNIFYDFSGQSGGAVLGGPNPIQTNVFSELIGVQTAARSDAARQSLSVGSSRLSMEPQLVFARERLERWRLSIIKQQLVRIRDFVKRGNLK